MKKGQVYEATVERVDFPCKGIARTQEGPVTVKNCLPGQKISLSVSKVRNGKAEGRLLEDCVAYGVINLAALPFYVLQFEFLCISAPAL